MKKFLMVAAIAAAPAVLADAPSYDYLQASFATGTMEFNGFGETDADGFAYRGAFSIDDSLFAQIDFLDLGTGSDAQIGAAHANSLSFGYHDDMFFARVGYEWVSGPELFIPAAGSGLLVDVGLRTIISEGLEVSAHYGRAEGSAGFGQSTMYGVAGAYQASESMAITVNYDLRKVSDYAELLIGPGLDVDMKSYGIGLRWNFD
jgi:hypothetical protein